MCKNKEIPLVIQRVEYIHFVQLVQEAFVDRNIDKFRDYVYHNKRLFAQYERLKELNPLLFRDSIIAGCILNDTKPDIRYAWIDKYEADYMHSLCTAVH